MNAKRNRTSQKKVLLIGLVGLAVIAGTILLYRHYHKNMNLAASQGQQAVQGTTSKPTTPQLPTNSSVGTGQGGVVDKNGQASGSLPPASDWVSSSNGDITLQQPSANSTVVSGDSLSGQAKVSTVQFILSDDTVGLIAQGNLNVVNGKFAGTLQFTPHSSSGKLEVYTPNPSNGAEEDVIDVDVNFNP